MNTIQIRSVQFRKKREHNWNELECIIQLVEQHGMSVLTTSQLYRLPLLYRDAVSSLNVARTVSLDINVLNYLESLVKRSYLIVYSLQDNVIYTIITFIVHRFPQTVVKFRWYIIIVFSFFISGFLSGFIMTQRTSDLFYSLVPKAIQQKRGPTSTKQELQNFLYTYDQQTVTEKLSVFAAFLFTHNTQIGILSFSLGIFFGLPVFYLIFNNGQSLGAFAAIYHQKGLSIEFWAWILPHGITEIFAIILCGAGGLMFALAIIQPGQYSRLDALKKNGKNATYLIVGAIIMFFIAAVIEGFFRQLVNSIIVRYIVALLTIILWIGYIYIFTKYQSLLIFFRKIFSNYSGTILFNKVYRLCFSSNPTKKGTQLPKHNL